MTDYSAEILSSVREIKCLLELLAEPAIAQRDARLRSELRQIVGSSKQKQKSVLLMDGTRRQKDIQQEAAVHKGNLSELVGRLNSAKLLTGDAKTPKLAISIPSNFFESDAKAR